MPANLSRSSRLSVQPRQGWSRNRGRLAARAGPVFQASTRNLAVSRRVHLRTPLDFRIVLSLRPGLNLHEVCLTHRTTAYLTRLIKQRQLQDVSILLEVHLQAGSLMCDKQDLDAQLSQHRLGDITWPHIAVFVMDPLREIHLRPGGRVFFKPPPYTP